MCVKNTKKLPPGQKQHEMYSGKRWQFMKDFQGNFFTFPTQPRTPGPWNMIIYVVETYDQGCWTSDRVGKVLIFTIFIGHPPVAQRDLARLRCVSVIKHPPRVTESASLAWGKGPGVQWQHWSPLNLGFSFRFIQKTCLRSCFVVTIDDQVAIVSWTTKVQIYPTANKLPL